MTFPEFELFLQPSPAFIEGERLLISGGESSIRKLSAFFTGEAKNAFGVEYRKLGQAMTCALETAKRLGPTAKPLESYLRRELVAGRHTAAMALGALGALEEETIVALARAIEQASSTIDLAAESAAALIACGQEAHPAFVRATSRLPAHSPLARLVKGRCAS